MNKKITTLFISFMVMFNFDSNAIVHTPCDQEEKIRFDSEIEKCITDFSLPGGLCNTCLNSFASGQRHPIVTACIAACGIVTVLDFTFCVNLASARYLGRLIDCALE